MADFRFYHPVEVRYGDLDPQGHVNNSRYLTYMEQARISYVAGLGLWKGDSFLDIGIILADAAVTFYSAINFGQIVRVGVRITRLGNKSMTMEYILEDSESGQKLASGSTVVVAYDYREGRSIALPDEWRAAISAFENLHG